MVCHPVPGQRLGPYDESLLQIPYPSSHSLKEPSEPFHPDL